MVVPVGETPVGDPPGHALAASLAGRRVAAVYAGSDPAAMEVAEVAAALLGVGLTGSASLGATDSGPTETEVVDRLREQLEEIADLHRGETVLVLAHEQALRLVVPALLGGLPAVSGTVELVNDADGWVLRQPGR